MTFKNYFAMAAMVAAMLSTEVSAQSFLKNIKKQLKQTTEQVVKKTVNDAANGDTENTDSKKSSSPVKKVARSANRSAYGSQSAQRSVQRTAAFNPSKEKVKIHLCDGIGIPLPPKLGTSTAASKQPPQTNDISKLQDWLATLPSSIEMTNARLVEESKWIGQVLKTRQKDEIYDRQMGIDDHLRERANAVERTMRALMSILKERATDYDSPEDSEEDAYTENFVYEADQLPYKVAMRSSLEPLYKYMDEKVVDFLKKTDVNTYTIELSLYSGGTDRPNCVRSGDFYFTVDPETRTAKLDAYRPKTAPASVVVPSTVAYGGRTFHVTEIGENAFYQEKISSITLPDRLKTIGSAAFAATDITSLELPNSLTELKESAFAAMPLIKSITIPSSVKAIPYALCSECKSLTTVVLPENVTEMKALVFIGCSALTSVTLPKNIKSIPERTFEECRSLANVDIPASVTKYEQLCFYHCTSLKSLPMGENVTQIDWRAFARCTGLTSIVVPARVDFGMLAFEYCTSLRAATIGSQYKNDPEKMNELSSIFSHCPVMPVKQGLHSGYVKFHDQ